MKSRIKQTLNGRRGFTLVELVVVLAIMGVMAAVAVPMVNNNLSQSKERAYNADLALIQMAVDGYYSAPDNARFLGLRQYPIRGFNTTGNLDTWSDLDADSNLTVPRNPLGGVRGGEPKWRDGGDSLRNEENLNAEAQSLAGSGSGWYVDKLTLEGTDHAADTRDYFIDFDLLVTAGLLKEVPGSASTDNTGGTASGSYSWFVDAKGSVNSLNVYFPTNGTGPGSNNGNDNRGFIEGVFP